MFIAVILGNVLSALMAICGVINIVLFCCDGWEGMDIAIFIQKLFINSIPLVVGSALFLLVQIATLIERQIIMRMFENARTEQKKQGRAHEHRSFGSAKGNFSSAEEVKSNQAAASASSVEKQSRMRQSPQARINASGPQGSELRSFAVDPNTGRPIAADPAAMNPAAAMASRGIQPGTFFHIEPVEYKEPTSLPNPTPEALTQSAANKYADPNPTDQPLPIPPEPKAPKGQPEQAPQEKQEQPAPKQDSGLSFFRVN